MYVQWPLGEERALRESGATASLMVPLPVWMVVPSSEKRHKGRTAWGEKEGKMNSARCQKSEVSIRLEIKMNSSSVEMRSGSERRRDPELAVLAGGLMWESCSGWDLLIQDTEWAEKRASRTPRKAQSLRVCLPIDSKKGDGRKESGVQKVRCSRSWLDSLCLCSARMITEPWCQWSHHLPLLHLKASLWLIYLFAQRCHSGQKKESS